MTNNEVVAKEVLLRQDQETGDVEVVLPCAPVTTGEETGNELLTMLRQLDEKKGKLRLICDPPKGT